jgi:hypothetical protein
MTSTSQDPSVKGDSGSSPEKQPETPKETRQVPLDALAEARQKARAAEERIAAMEAELARLKTPQQPAAAAQPQSEIEKIGRQLQEMQHKERVRELTVELGLADDKQAAYVAELHGKYPDLTPTEAFELAAKRKPDMFKEMGQPGFDPRIHGSTRPRAGVPPEPKPSDRAKRIEAMKKATGSDKHKLLNNYVGGLAAQALGWGKDHKKSPI